MKKKNNELDEYLLSRFAILVLLIIVLILSCLMVGIIKLNHINKDSIKEFENHKNKFDIISNDIEIDTSIYGDIQDIEINDSSTRLYDNCMDGCNLRINSGGIPFYYLVNKNYLNGKYTLSIVKDNKAIIYNKDIGESVINLQILYYFNYLTLYNTYIDNTFKYDYAISVDSNNNYDEFTSLNSNEMEFSSKGITYYYDLCDKDKAYKIKAVRKPLSNKTYIISKSEEEFTWCESVK